MNSFPMHTLSVALHDLHLKVIFIYLVLGLYATQFPSTVWHRVFPRFRPPSCLTEILASPSSTFSSRCVGLLCSQPELCLR